MRRPALLAAAILGALVAAFIHVEQISPHLAHVPWLAAGFCASVMFTAVWLLTLSMFPRSRLLLAVGAAGHAVMLLAGAVSRTPGLGLPGKGVEDPTAVWVVAMCAEAIVVAGCALLLRGGKYGLEASHRAPAAGHP